MGAEIVPRLSKRRLDMLKWAVGSGTYWLSSPSSLSVPETESPVRATVRGKVIRLCSRCLFRVPEAGLRDRATEKDEAASTALLRKGDDRSLNEAVLFGRESAEGKEAFRMLTSDVPSYVRGPSEMGEGKALAVLVEV